MIDIRVVNPKQPGPAEESLRPKGLGLDKFEIKMVRPYLEKFQFEPTRPERLRCYNGPT